MIIIDTSDDATEEKHKEKFKAYNMGILLLQDRAVFETSALEGTRDISYSNIFTSNIEGKDAFLGLISSQNLISSYLLFFITMFIYLFSVYFVSNIIDVLILGAIGYIFARILRLRLKFRATFNIGVHALTLPIILNLIYILVNTITGFRINNFQWMYTSISYIYVAVAILMIKTEIINQRIQLIRLRQIQEEVKEEAEDKPKEEKKEENKQEEKKEEEKQSENKTGEEPEGSNA